MPVSFDVQLDMTPPHPLNQITNDSAYYSICNDSVVSDQHHLMCSSIIYPHDEYYSHMAERYQSMQISSCGIGKGFCFNLSYSPSR